MGIPWKAVFVLVVGCGQVSSNPIDAPHGDTSTVVDAAPDAPPDAPSGPTPRLYWSFDNNLNNAGALTGYTIVAPAGISYAAGKSGMGIQFANNQYAYSDGMHTSLETYAKVTIAFWLKEPGNVQGTAFWDNNNRGTSPYGGVQLGLTNTNLSACVSTSTASFLGGSCLGFTMPSANTFHHWIMRYDGSGTGAGQGAPLQIYVDDVLVHTRANDANNNPIWNPGAPDRMTLGASGAIIDELKIYNQVFTTAEQCTYVIGGSWNGATCNLP